LDTAKVLLPGFGDFPDTDDRLFLNCNSVSGHASCLARLLPNAVFEGIFPLFLVSI